MRKGMPALTFSVGYSSAATVWILFKFSTVSSSPGEKFQIWCHDISANHTSHITKHIF